MNMRHCLSLVSLVSLALAGAPARGEEAAARSQEAKGLVTDTGVGAFSLEEKGTTRLFNLSAAKSRYEPDFWRPAKGDQVTVAFTPDTRKDGKVVLAVDKATLVKAGPDTVPGLKSPVAVEVTEVGRSGIKGKVATGQIVDFAYQRGTKRLPAGWVVAVGEKARVEFKAAPRPFGFGVNLAIVSIEKQTDAK